MARLFYIHTYIHAYMQTYIHTPTYPHTYIDTYLGKERGHIQINLSIFLLEVDAGLWTISLTVCYELCSVTGWAKESPYKRNPVDPNVHFMPQPKNCHFASEGGPKHLT